MATVRYTVVDGQVLAESRNGVRKFYDSDANGNVTGLYDDTQTKTDSFTYWPFGETRTNSGSTPTKYKFSGAWGCRSQANGDIYMRRRIEAPKDGRWLSVDPEWPSMEAYSYAFDNPVTFTDPSGNQPTRPSQLPPKIKDCLSARAEKILIDKLKDKKCADAIQKECGKSGMAALNDKRIVPKIVFEKDCLKGFPGIEFGSCLTSWPAGTFPPVPSGTPGCQVVRICLSSDMCNGTGPYKGYSQLAQLQACAVLFELGNACNCAKGPYESGEAAAIRIRDACGCKNYVGGAGQWKR